MGSRNFRIAIPTKNLSTIDVVKEKLNDLLKISYGDYHKKNWTDNRIYLEVTAQNIIIQNQDLCNTCLTSQTTIFEHNIFKVFEANELLAYYINDSDGTRGFALSQAESKRLWYVLETRTGLKIENVGHPIVEEAFTSELTETLQQDEPLDSIYSVIYSHPTLNPMHGQVGVIERIMRNILLDRYSYDYEWQEFTNGLSLVESDDFALGNLFLQFD